MGAHLLRFGRGQEELLPDTGLDDRAGAPAGRRGAKKGTPKTRVWGVSRGGLSSKIHLLADENGLPVAFRITPGQAAEYAEAIRLLEGQRAEAVIADKGYDSAEIVARIEASARWPSSLHDGTGSNPTAATGKSPNSANRIERCFYALNSSAASANDTAEPSKPSDPPQRSHAPGSDSSYMRISPSAQGFSGRFTNLQTSLPET